MVEDAPFQAVAMAVTGDGAGRRIAFRTNVDDLVPVDAEHPLRFDRDPAGGVKPYVRVRGALWARLTRALACDLVALGEERDCRRGALFGVAAARPLLPDRLGPEAAA